MDSIALQLLCPQLQREKSNLQVEQTHNNIIADVRIHVERVIGNYRQKYKFLSNTQPIDYLTHRKGLVGNVTTLDMVVSVCCALTDLCNPVVPSD